MSKKRCNALKYKAFLLCFWFGLDKDFDGVLIKFVTWASARY